MGSKMTAERAAYLKTMKKAARLREKVRKGTATEKDRAELARMPKPKSSRGRPRKVVDDQVEQAHDEPESPRTEVADAGAEESELPPSDTGDEPAGQPPPPPPPRPAPEPPPVVVLPKTGGDWRGRYRTQAGREGVCREVAGAYCGFLKKLVAYIESTGTTPVMDAGTIDSAIFPAAVLTVDKFLPADFEMGPEVEVAIGSGVIIGQAALTARKQKATQKKVPGKVIPFSQPAPEPAPAAPAAEEPPPMPADDGGEREGQVKAKARPVIIRDETVY